MSKNEQGTRRDPAQAAAEARMRSQGEMTLTPLPDGTYRMENLKIGEPNKRYWHHNEQGQVVWQAHADTVHVPNGVSVIGPLRCPTLGEVALPPSVRDIDDLAFGAEFFTSDTYERYALHTVHFSQGLQRIGHHAFYNCVNLDGVHLPKGLQEIEEEAFCTCVSLSRITIPASVEHIGYRAFAHCPALEKVVFQDGIRRLSQSVFAGDGKLHKVILPQTLEFIGRSCFANCTALAEIDLPESLTELGGYAFDGCVSLTAFRFKRDLQNAEAMRRESPFRGCTALTEFYLDAAVTRADFLPFAPALTAIKAASDHPHFTTVNGALYTKDKKTLLRVPTGYVGEFTLPRGVKAIAPHAFRDCVGITEVILPSTLLTVGESAFAGCTALRSIDLPGKLTEIGNGTFQGCTALARVHVPGSVRRIAETAFSGCTALPDIPSRKPKDGD